jgi:hypothetical protein
LDFSRLKPGDQLAAASGLALLVFMFFDWFEPGISGFDIPDFTGFLVALAGVAGVSLGGLAAAGQRLNIAAPRGAGTLVLGKLAVLLIIWFMLVGEGDLKVGIFLSLIAAAGIAIGAWLTLREGGFEPLVAAAGGRTRAASRASAPAAKPATTRKPASRSTARKSSGSSKRSTGTRKTSSRSSGSKSRSGGTRRSSGARKK